MAIPVSEAEGDLTATGGGVEDTVATISTPRVLTFVVDLSNMVAGDSVTLTCKRKVQSGDTLRVVHEEIFTGYQVNPIAISVPMPSPHQAAFTITLETSTPRVFPWSVEST